MPPAKSWKRHETAAAYDTATRRPTLRLNVSIHRSAWKGYSPKLVCRMPHNPRSLATLWSACDFSVPQGQPLNCACAHDDVLRWMRGILSEHRHRYGGRGSQEFRPRVCY